MTPQHRSARPAALARSVSLYAAVLLVGVAVFFGLHYAGNRIPYDLALERITDELESERRDLGYVAGIGGDFEYCQRAAVVLGGAKRFEGDNPVVDAVLPRTIVVDGADDYCETLTLLRGNENLRKWWIKQRYWWGGTPLYAIALRFLSDADIREWTRILTVFAWGLLSLAAWFLSRRAFLVVAPLAVFASFFSGLQYFSDAGTGMPFLWTPLFAAALGFVMLRRPIGRATRLCCFAIGMGSSYLWLLDGHNVLLIALIGLVVYFGSDYPGAGRRAGIATLHIAFYAAGFTLCFATGQLVKAAFAEWAMRHNSFWGVIANVFMQFSARNDRFFASVDRTLTDGWAAAPIIREFPRYWLIGPDRVGFGQAVTLLSALLFAVALAFAAAQFFRGRKSLLADMAWIAVPIAAVAAQLILPDDLPKRSARYLFIWHALCWSSFLLAAKEAFSQWREPHGPAEPNAGHRLMAGFRRSRSSADRLHARLPVDVPAGVFFAGAVIAVAVFAWSLSRSESAFARDTIAEQQPRIYGPFNVYHHENRLVYARAECDEYDVAPRFKLYIVPVNADALPDDRAEHGFDSLDFRFTEHKVPYGEGCAAVVALPDYKIEAVSTGQFIKGGRQIWSGEFRPDQPPPPSVAAMMGLLENAELLAQSEFGIYRNENALILVKNPCRTKDVSPRFFMHVDPVRVGDLQEDRQPYGFDNLDFNFFDHGAMEQGGACIAAVQLPDYPVAAARTGQFTAEGEVWSAALRFDRPSALVVDSMMKLLEDAELLAQSNFDIHRNENMLLWTKTPCDVSDATPRFFVHLQPVNIVDLPEERQQFGFDNMDFNFADRGGVGQGRTCIAAVELPGYPVAVARTGQFTAEGVIWQETIEFR